MLLVLRPIIYYLMCVKAAKQLFYKLFDSVIYKKFDFFIKNSDGTFLLHAFYFSDKQNQVHILKYLEDNFSIENLHL
jgi:hypothetical protein